MSGRSYPALRIQLAGDVGSVQAAIESMRNAASQLLASAPRLRSALNFAGTWDGKAAGSYRSAGSDLAPALNSGTESLGIAGSALETWATRLADNQRVADEWERQAEAIQRQLAAAKSAYQAAFAHIRPGMDPSVFDPAQLGGDGVAGETPALRQAYARWSGLDAQLNDLQIRAEELRQKHISQAATAAARISSARPNAFEPATHPGVLQSIVNGVTDAAGTVAQWSATVTAIAAPIPGVDVVDAITGPLAAGAGGIHLAGEAEQLITHSSAAPSMTGFLLDAVDARRLPGEVRAVRAAREGSPSLAATFRHYADNKHVATAERAGDLPRTEPEQIARGRAVARRPALAATAKVPFQLDSGSSMAAADGVGLVIDPSKASVATLLEDQARVLGQHQHPAPVAPPSVTRDGSVRQPSGVGGCGADERPWDLARHRQ